jgi:hypothetical protein
VRTREKLAGKGLDHGPRTIAWHLEHHHGVKVSANSIHRHLRAAGKITQHRGNRRFSIGYDGVATPVSSSIRSESALLVGSMIREH